MIDFKTIALAGNAPGVFNHTLEKPRAVSRSARRRARRRVARSAQAFQGTASRDATQFGIASEFGESFAHVGTTLNDLSVHAVQRMTVGQYLQPTAPHHPVLRYRTSDPFKTFTGRGYRIGFEHVASEPRVRSSYHIDEMAHAAGCVQIA